ncbi:hypothetical protein CS912_16680 [Klebsiella variicola]|uniref:DUF4365 domain-containing protein n=1 Tax=Klebsiella variicola TaxID=244366 RepID=UPI000C57E052|nr:DUF4365 domain-containing protein [Klebsiella variicola]PHZ93557.1 hypothetical protein CS911_17155 [Klebsiella variicola]PIA07395.1 hypothetical protein CS912_16680 [Klebsiella variicola]
MTRVTSESHIGELGSAFLQYLCSKQEVIYRPVRIFDVGIDAFIEPQVGNIATGAMIGVQIKTGKSFKTSSGRYSFKSDKAHFEYWSRCTLPIIGVVYDPEDEKGVWVNLSDIAKDRLTNKGPWVINLSVQEHLLDSDSLQNLIDSAELTRIKKDFIKFSYLTMPQSNQKKEKDSFQNLSTISSHTAWDELLDTFLSLLYDDRIVADAGYRLSLYFPKEKSNFRYKYIIKRLSLLNDVQLIKMIFSVKVALDDCCEHVAEHICNIMRYIPDICLRLESIIFNNNLSNDVNAVAIQLIESLSEYERQDLWDMISNKRLL